MTVKEIVINYLQKNNYDGLQNGIDCGCKIDDLMPCEGGVDCKPGYLRFYDNNKWIIVEKKEG